MIRVTLRLFMGRIIVPGFFPSLMGAIMGAAVVVVMSGKVGRGWRTKTQGKLDPCLTILTLDLKVSLAV